MKVYKFYPLEFEFYSFPSLHNKGEKNGPFAQLPPPHKKCKLNQVVRGNSLCFKVKRLGVHLIVSTSQQMCEINPSISFLCGVSSNHMILIMLAKCGGKTKLKNML